MNRHTLAIVLLTTAIAGLSWWLAEITEPKQQRQQVAGHHPDYYAEDLSITTYDETGHPKHRLVTNRLVHFRDDDSAELEHPHLWLYEPATPPWKLRAEQARITNNGENIFLPGKVFIDREGQGEKRPYHITTFDLKVQPKLSYAETDGAFRLDSRRDWVTSIGMRGWFKEPARIKLLSEVRSRYETQ